MLRRIVPALGVIALASPAAMSQEIAKGLFLDGWVDTIFTVTDSQYEAEGPKNGNNSAYFDSTAKVKIAWNVTEQVSGKVGVKFNNSTTAGDVDGDGTPGTAADQGKSSAYLQEAFFSANVGNGFNVTAGKMISFIGLQSAEPTGLFRVGVTPSINLYTPDILGASVGYSNDQFAAAVIVNNGNFDDSGYNDLDAKQTQNNVSHNLGYGIDLTYNLPEKMGNVNLELAYDPMGPNDKSTYQVGLNATLKPAEKTTVLAEVIYRATSGAASKKNSTEKVAQEDIGWMLLANQVVTTEGIPASVTGSFGQYAPGFNNDESNTMENTKSEVAAAVLTNPFGSSAFGVNAEVAYAWYDGVKGQNLSGKEGGTTVSLEALVVIP